MDKLSGDIVTPWHEHLTETQKALLVVIPVGSLIFIVVLLRLIWKPVSAPKFSLPKQVPTYGAVPTETTEGKGSMEKDESVIQSGQVAGGYDSDWKKTFDYVFLMSMVVFFVFLSILTALVEPQLWSNGEFWLFMIPKLAVMMGVSFLGGFVCRKFCTVDDDGYIMTTKSSAFKVNYTRKFQHFAAYMVPLVIKPSASCNCSGPLALAWGDFTTMLGFLCMIKPIRERITFFMLQFNSLDRPEDRPHTLKWIIAGNIAPGLVLLLFFRWLFSFSNQGNLVFIIVFITGIGDGLAEPVGIAWGKHKYATRSCFSPRKYTRSWEGSACVFLSGMIFPALQYKDFASSTQLWITMALLPPIVAYAEATAPHTMDTPVLMILTGLILYGIINLV